MLLWDGFVGVIVVVSSSVGVVAQFELVLADVGLFAWLGHVCGRELEDVEFPGSSKVDAFLAAARAR